MMEHVDDLRAFLEKADAAPAHLVGHSYGAFVCLLLAVSDPVLVRSLALAEPPAITLFVSNKPKPSELIKLIFTRPRTAVGIIKFGATGADPATAAARKGDMEKAMRLFGNAVLGRKAFHHLPESRLEQVRANLIKAEFTGSGFAPLDDNKLREIRIPTLLINAQHSPALFHRLTDRLQELMPHAERMEIRDASHILHEDNPSDYNAAIRAFLKEHTGIAS